MEFENYDKLYNYVSKWLDEANVELVWHWLQQGMITEDKIKEITKECCCDEECFERTLRINAWQTFVNERIYK